MARYFVALLPSEAIHNSAIQIQQYFAARYSSRKAQNSPPHITLQPPFEWSLDQASALEQCLVSFVSDQRSIPIKLSGFAAFPPRVIYINVLKTPELVTLQTELRIYLESSLGILDLTSKSRSYKPHMTVAFRDLTRTNFKAAWAEFQHQSFEFQFMAPALTLLLHNGQRWNALMNFPLLPDTSNTLATIEDE